MRRGYQAEIHYGVTKEDTGKLIAHAWLEYEGQAIIGGYGLNRYVRLGRRADSPNSEQIEHR
jgi:hypothetical protein